MRILSSAVEARFLDAELQEFTQNSASKRGCPPSYNMGGTSDYPPTPLPLGFEHLGAAGKCLPGVPVKQHQKTKIDFLAFTVPAGTVENDDGQHINLVRFALRLLFDTVEVCSNPKGMYGYPASSVLSVNGLHIGIWCSGADHGKDYVQITGAGCALWNEEMYSNVADVLQVMNAKINRIDLCLDFFRGEVTYDDVVAGYAKGDFKLPRSPSQPEISTVSTNRGDQNLGRTLYIGKRKCSKMARCYEKGLELFARMPEDFRESCTDPENLVYGPDNGAPVGTIAEQWFRVEVEYKAVDLFLDYSMILDRDKNFAGAYPFCASILGLADGIRPKRLKKSSEIDNEKLFIAARNGYGNAVHTWRSIGLSDSEILDKLDSGRHNSRLVRAGILIDSQSTPLPQDHDIPF